jgi:hypothetical protein
MVGMRLRRILRGDWIRLAVRRRTKGFSTTEESSMDDVLRVQRLRLHRDEEVGEGGSSEFSSSASRIFHVSGLEVETRLEVTSGEENLEIRPRVTDKDDFELVGDDEFEEVEVDEYDDDIGEV